MDAARVYGGFSVLDGGQDGGRSASLIRPDQASALINSTVRGSLLKTRPPYTNWPLTFATGVQARWTGKFQGALQYDGEIGQSGWIVSRGGKLFFINSDTFIVTEITPRLFLVTTADFVVPALNSTVDVFINSESVLTTGQNIYIDSGQYQITNRFTNEIEVKYLGGAANATALSGNGILDITKTQIFEYQSNPAYYDFVYLFQAENYAIILAEQHKTIIFDGAQARLASWNEVPSGVLGAYGWGRIWIVRADRRTFVAGDIVFGPSGTPQLGKRDAILKFTENDFLNEGGAFGVPYNAGPITCMQFLTSIDNSLGLGVLLVGTTNMVFSVNAPVDRTTWKSLTYPIQTVSLLDYGPEGPRSSISVDGDMWYRSTDGFRSFRTAQVHFGQPGNTPLSREITPVIDFDTEALLFYGSSIKFDNRFLSTFSPFRSDSGVQHRGLAVINFDLVSTLQGKSAPAWEGAWTGINILQLTKGRIQGKERAFAFAMGSDIELWEIKKTGYYDEFTTVSGGHTTITRKSIASVIETRSDPHGDPTQLKQLHMGELYIDELFDNVTIVVKFRPDQYPTWVTWATINLCATVSQCTMVGPVGAVCAMWKMNAKQYASRITIPQPPETCNVIAGIPIKLGREFQFRLERTGSCRIRGFRTHANIASQKMEGECPPEVTCTSFQDCGTDWFTYKSSDASGPTPPTPTIYYNSQQCAAASCPSGQTNTPPGPVTKCVAAGTYSGSSADGATQASVDALALQDATNQAGAALVCSGGSCSNDVPVMTNYSVPSGLVTPWFLAREVVGFEAWRMFDNAAGYFKPLPGPPGPPAVGAAYWTPPTPRKYMALKLKTASPSNGRRIIGGVYGTNDHTQSAPFTQLAHWDFIADSTVTLTFILNNTAVYNSYLLAFNDSALDGVHVAAIDTVQFFTCATPA